MPIPQYRIENSNSDDRSKSKSSRNKSYSSKSSIKSKSTRKNKSASLSYSTTSQSASDSAFDALAKNFITVDNLREIPNPKKKGLSIHIVNVRRKGEPYGKLLKLYKNGVLKEKTLIRFNQWNKYEKKAKELVHKNRDKIMNMALATDEKLLQDAPSIAIQGNTDNYDSIIAYATVGTTIALGASAGVMGTIMTVDFLCGFFATNWAIQVLGQSFIESICQAIDPSSGLHP